MPSQTSGEISRTASRDLIFVLRGESIWKTSDRVGEGLNLKSVGESGGKVGKVGKVGRR